MFLNPARACIVRTALTTVKGPLTVLLLNVNSTNNIIMFALPCLFLVLLTSGPVFAENPVFGSYNGGACEHCLDEIYIECGGSTSAPGFATCICATAGIDVESCETNVCLKENSFYYPEAVKDWFAFCGRYGPNA